MLSAQLIESWTPSTESEKAAVQQQLEKLLATSLFNSSKRYPSFLRFVVGRALAGQPEQLKERILGVEVFDRPADYDTNSDPIVRVTAAEIRKRIELYYQDPKHQQEIRLVIPPGSYAPQFSWTGHTNGAAVAKAASASSSTSSVTINLQTPAMIAAATPDRSAALAALARRVLPYAAGLAGVVALALVVWLIVRPPAIKQFWQPFISAPEPVLFCIADQNQYSSIRLRDAANPQREITLKDSMVTIIIDDVVPVVNLAGMLRSYGKTFRVLGESTTSLTDLRRGPSVFIGAYDNNWTLRLTSPLRFHFANDPDMNQFWIEDRANPGKHDWVLDRSVQQQTGTYKDYAIVARMIDPNTDQFVVVIAGIGRGGTVAAGEFLVDSHRMDELNKQLPSDWKHKNVELVLETQVIEGTSGPPRITAVHTW